MKRKLLLASILIFLSAVLVIGFLLTGFPFYRYQSAACKQQGAAYAAREEKLERDSREKLRIGTRKDAVIRFFAENGIPVAFVRGEANGTISTIGCAPAGCGSDDAVLGLHVKVDDLGTVVAEPVVVGLYTNCL
jgi:hypothetical protein